MKKLIACFTAAIMTMAVFTGCILKKETERTEKSKVNVESTDIESTVDTSADSSANEEVETSVGNDESAVSEESEDGREIEFYEDILKNPYSHTAIIDPSSKSFNNHSYFIADINSDNKYELVIKGETKEEEYDPYGVLTIVKADREIIKWEYSNTPDFHADGIISYGRVATHFPQNFVNINSGDLWEAGSFDVGSDDVGYRRERVLTNIVTGETIQGETADKKEEELSSGALLYPKWTDYDVYNAKDTKIVVLEKEDIEYNWRNAYLKLVEDMETSGTLSRCALLYIDNDDIPELYIVPSYSDCGEMYSFYNGKLIENTSFNSGGYSLDYCVERTGKLCGRMIPIGGIHLLYQEYQNGEFKDILYASSTGYDTWHGTINDVEVTEQEYNSQVDAVDERENATPIILKSYQEILPELMDIR